MAHDEAEIQRVIGAVANEAGGLGIAIADVAGRVDELTRAAVRQAEEFAALRQAVEEMTAESGRIAEAASQASTTVGTAAAEAASSRAAMEASLADMTALAAATSETGRQLEKLNAAFGRVGEVASTIDAIARQTNLLALNATIEAARAGEHGKGFAVVAGEVKELAAQTTQATAEIQATLSELNAQSRALIETSADNAAKAEAAQAGTQRIGATMDTMSGALEEVDREGSAIARAAAAIGERCATVTEAIAVMSDDVDASKDHLGEANERLSRLTSSGEKLLGLSIVTGAQTVDTPFVHSARETAARIGQLFEAAVEHGEITVDDLFDEDYQAIPGTEPQQLVTRFTEFTDRVLPEVQEALAGSDERIVFCAAVDRNGYLPTHNLEFSQPQRPGEVDWNTANCRNRRMFDDRVGLAAGRSTHRFLLQTYRRDMGGGAFAMMKDVSAPIYVDGRHWGAFRIGYKA